jgi:hypothetical protein
MSGRDLEKILIDALTFDTLVSKYRIENIKMIKIDIEGFKKNFFMVQKSL